MMLLLYPHTLKAKPPAEDDTGDHFLEATVRPDSKLIGRTVEQGGLRKLGHLFLGEMGREGRAIAPVGPDLTIRGGGARRVVRRKVDRVELGALRNPCVRAGVHRTRQRQLGT